MITDHSDSDGKVDGGVQAVTKYLVNALVRRDDIDLHVVSFRYGSHRQKSTEEDGYTRHVLPGGSLGTLTGFRQDQNTLNKLLASISPHIVHGQGAGHNGVMAARAPYPSVITIHGIMAEEAKHLSGLPKRVRHWLLSRISERHCITNATHTILITPYVAEYFADRLAGNRYFIPNPIAEGFFSIPRDEVPGRLLFAGRLYRLKGVIDLVEAAAAVAPSRHLELHLAGSLADREYVARLRQAAVNSGIADKVKFLGLLDEAALRRELGEAAVLVLPSYQETAPMVIVEAMAAGVPVIATDVGGTRHLVAEGETGYLIRPGDALTLTERLNRLLANHDLRGRFGEAARIRAGEDYRADRVAERTVEVYRRALADPYT